MTAGATWTGIGAHFSVKARQVGYTRDNGSGVGSGTWQRWALVPVRPDGLPALLWRDGKARHVGPRVSGATCPLWLRRAESYVGRIGTLTLAQLADVAEWYRAHRVGEYPTDRLESIE